MVGGELNVWLCHKNKEGRPYYFNPRTKESTWALPSKDHDWIQCIHAESNQKFYHNPATGRSHWKLKKALHKCSTNNKVEARLDKDCIRAESKAFNSESEEIQWEKFIDESTGKPYYYNRLERRSVWEIPDTASSYSYEEKDSEQDSSAIGGNCEADRYKVVETANPETTVNIGTQKANCKKAIHYDYVVRHNGNRSVFGKRSWRRKFLVIEEGKLGFFKSHVEYQKSRGAQTGAMLNLLSYKVEGSLLDPYSVRLIPINREERVFHIVCDDLLKKEKLLSQIRASNYGDA